MSDDRPAIRAAVARDVAGIRRIIESNNLFPPEMIGDMIAPALDGSAADDLWLVADDGVVRGVVFCRTEQMTSGTWNALLLAVDASTHGHGIGSALMAAIEARVVARAAHLLLVETSGLDQFARTRAFYSGIGFAREAQIRDFYALGEDKIIFRKALSVA